MDTPTQTEQSANVQDNCSVAAPNQNVETKTPETYIGLLQEYINALNRHIAEREVWRKKEQRWRTSHPDVFTDFRRPCVYLYSKAGEIIYVGKSKCGLFRVFDSKRDNHSMAQREADTIRVLWFDQPGEASTMERDLIRKHQPKFNIQGVRRTNA